MLRGLAILACLTLAASCAPTEPQATGAPVPLAQRGLAPPPPACGPRSRVIEHLARGFGEAPAAVGLSDNGALLEIFATEDGETWTALVSLPNGMTCLVFTGTNWEVFIIGRGS